MTRAKKHHYISQFYLRGFGKPTGSAKRNKSHLLGVIDITQKRMFSGAVKNFAFQNNFNRLEQYHDHENELEEALAKVEGEISSSVRALDETGELVESDTKNLITLMALFASRTPVVRAQIKDQTRFVEEELFHALTTYPHLSENRSDGVTFEMLQEAKANGQMNPTDLSQDSIIHTELNLVRDLTRDLSKRKWHVLKCNNCTDKFITSDCPVVLHIRDGGIVPIHFSNNSVLEQHTDVYFPVTKNIAIIGTLTPIDLPTMDTAEVALLNTWVINNGGRNFYSDPEGFVVLNEESEITTHEDVIEVLQTYEPDIKKPYSQSRHTTAENWSVTDVQDWIDAARGKLPE